MVVHIVNFKLKEENRDKNISILKDKLLSLKDGIKEIYDLEVGINISSRDVAYDLVLVSSFKTVEDLNVYRDHERHQEVLKFIKEVVDKVVIVDYDK